MSGLFSAIRRDFTGAPDRALETHTGELDDCAAAAELWGGPNGLDVVLGGLLGLLDFFVDPNCPEVRSLHVQAAPFLPMQLDARHPSTDARAWVRHGRSQDLGALYCMAEIATRQGRLPRAHGEALQVEIAAMLRASERIH